jgi:tetratricopeptide (TPR) repeat protein
MMEKIMGLVENLEPIALIGAGGIGKTSIALTVLHHDRVKERFGENRRFIRCDQFPASRAHFLARLSKVIGANVENPEDLTPLRPSLSSKEIFMVLDNAESILDPRGVNSQEIYEVVEELSQLGNVFLCITSRISALPPDCETLEIPTLPMEAARNAFYRIYKHRTRSDSVDDILKQLDFHPLSVTLLATVAHQNKWDYNRLVREWEQRQTDILHTEHNRSLAATIELSLASPMFKELGPSARGLLEVVAFFPQGVDEDNLSWLFPTISNAHAIFDKFSILSLTYRSDKFITMLAPLRDCLRPKDPKLSPLLCAAKDNYFTRMSVELDPERPGFRDARWITSEDVNVEHLLDVFTSMDANSDDIWDACCHFMLHLRWHKPRQTMLQPKFERLPDDHPSKSLCLYELSHLYRLVGNYAGEKRLLAQVLMLERKRQDDDWVSLVLVCLSDANRVLGFHEEGIQQAKEALGIYERVDDRARQAECWNRLAWLLYDDGQFDAAEEAGSLSIKLLPEEGEELRTCESHHILGRIYGSKGEREKAIHHLEAALAIASTFDWHDLLIWVHISLAELFSDEGSFGDAHAHLERAKLHAVDDAYRLARAMELQATVFHRQGRLGEAKSEAVDALEIFEKLGVAGDQERCRILLQDIETKVECRSTSGESISSGELLEAMLCPTRANSPFLARGTPPNILENTSQDTDREP